MRKKKLVDEGMAYEVCAGPKSRMVPGIPSSPGDVVRAIFITESLDKVMEAGIRLAQDAFPGEGECAIHYVSLLAARVCKL
jgi:hypothetical protein